MVMKMKKKLFSAVILVTLLASVLPSLPVMASPDPGLVGLWHFDEGSGTTASDSSGNNYNGVIFGAIYVDGKSGKALLFDGTNDYVNVPDPGASNLDLNRVTIEAWIYMPTEVPTGFRNIVRKGHGLDRCYGLDMGYPNAQKIRGWVNLGQLGGSSALWVQSGTLLLPDQWYHVVMTYDGSSVKLYLNGVLDSWSTSITGNIYDNDLSVRIGGQPAGDSQGSMPFKGLIDEVRIYNIALSSTVVNAHSHLDYTPPTADTGGPYTGDEGSPVTLTGSATDPEDGTLTYEWELDNDGLYDDATGVSVLHTWADNGVYPIGLRVTDEYGLFTTDSTTVIVSNVPPTIAGLTASPTPASITSGGVIVTASATFTDPGTLDTHTATWDWGDGSLPTTGTVVEAGGSGSVGDSHTYTSTGVYTITLTVTDKDGVSDTEIFEYIVIYGPGFVTGGGWIYSPPRAYTAKPDLEGKANFGFVSKYQKGANVPTGNTEFIFHVAEFKFKSTSYEWLVVTGSDRAQFKGFGTINGAGEYGFMLTAEDNTKAGDPDTFRLKIWDAVETIIYDNGAQTPISGGSIVVHK
jgi:PKD repeat protein